LPPFASAPPEWAEAAERILHHDIRTVAVIGATDVGRSTLCRFLQSQAIQAGRSVALLDTDVGQKMFGPPACVTMLDAHGLRLSFIGTTDPVPGWARLIEGTRHLIRQTDAEIAIVNTSGLLAGPGRRLKAAKMETLKPDLLVALGDSSDLEAILDKSLTVPVLRLPRPSEARRKTKGERRAARRDAFRRYFKDASVLTLACFDPQLARPVAPSPKGLLLGLADRQGNGLGLGILVDGLAGTAIKILTPVAEREIERMIPGTISLDENFSELGLERGHKGVKSP
jgi:polynucleotide 5'-hydroxyl-kinase GRC3/NOL9